VVHAVSAAALIRRPDGLRYRIAYDPAATDGVTRLVAAGRGHILNDHLIRLMLRLVRRGDVVLDLGAHIGTFALAAAAAGCRVIAVEASPANAALLATSAARNRFDDLEVVNCATAGRGGPIRFCSNGPYGHVATRTTRAASELVPAVRVDELLRQRGVERVALVKMDVEGSEIRTLRGMAGLISHPDPPPLLYELNGHCLDLYGATVNDLLRALEGYGYASYLIERPWLVRVRAREWQPQTLSDCLAAQTRPELRGWRIVDRIRREERIERLLDEASDPSPKHRRYAARSLTRAGREVLRDGRIVRAIEMLRQDPVPAVRRAASWWRSATARRA
jgi:FkbM family methyltransferase